MDEWNETMQYAGGVVVLDEVGYPVRMVTGGVRCGACKVRHNSTAAVRYCHDLYRTQIAEQEAEIAAERAIERYFEERGYEEARAQEAYEARMGVIPFDVALADAIG